MTMKATAVTVASLLIAAVALVYAGLAWRGSGKSEPHGGPASTMDITAGRGMMMGGWPDYSPWDGQPPKKLPTPQDQEWLASLRRALAEERLSALQYSEDARRWSTPMPYRMIIPQEADHIEWLTGLLQAYGLPPGDLDLPVQPSSSVTEAYQIGARLEAALVDRYVTLVSNAPDDVARRVLDATLLESRMHQMMFQHVQQTGGGMGGMMRGRGPGRMMQGNSRR
ncbi:MAG: ferritin family protein [Armatimonadota bacterium]